MCSGKAYYLLGKSGIMDDQEKDMQARIDFFGANKKKDREPRSVFSMVMPLILTK